MSTEPKFRSDAKIQWYRCQVDPKLMSELMKCSDWQGYKQAVGHLGLWLVTGTVAYLNFTNVHGSNWYWSVPLLLASLFVHGTVGSFLGGTACHELSHKTPFKNKAVNDFFLKVFAFFGWWDQVWFRPSHIRHHQVTVHHDYDGEVVLPGKFDFRKNWRFWLGLLAWDPTATWKTLRTYYFRATGRLDNAWFEFVLPEGNAKLRREHRNWARFTLIGHAVLAAIFIATGHWFLIFVFDLGSQYCGWLGFLTGAPQHYGMIPDVPDHRLSCRTFTCTWLPRFLYWNMNYHVEHHMFPAVPFHQLPRLREAIAHDLPPARHGLWDLWTKEMLVIHCAQQTDPNFTMAQRVQDGGARADDRLLENEAALTI
jgi:fatty acid desaturase